jgi:alpha-D-ribose 1-methylphosphonate 5-triphosphate synthase subunit PhnG
MSVTGRETTVSDVGLSREERWALLATAGGDELIELADMCLDSAPEFAVILPPEVGCVSAQVRDPILRERFLLGDVLACRAEVEVNGVRGWAMRLGDDRAAVLAMAILDAAAETGPDLADAVEHLCQRLAQRLRRADDEEWAELAPTVVEFEEL